MKEGGINKNEILVAAALRGTSEREGREDPSRGAHRRLVHRAGGDSSNISTETD